MHILISDAQSGPTLTRQGLSPLISLPGYGSQKSGARSQNGGAVGVEKPAGFLQRGGQGAGVAVSEVVGKDQVIAAFFERSFRDVQVARFVGFAAPAESFGDIGGNGHRRAAHL